MKIIIDAMGGDHAPNDIVRGAIDASREFGVDMILVGHGETILRCLNDIGLDNLPKGIEVANADDVVSMEDDPTTVMREHRNSSMVVGLKMLADGSGDAFISAGSTGALLTAATLTVKRIRGVRRAALGPVLPTKGGSMVLIDCGANVECTPEFMLQFGFMGSVYAQKFLGIENPRVALLSNGTEACKGTPLVREAYQLLTRADEAGLIRFVGNIEGRDAMLGGADVVVADGFSGNVFLKTVEGTALFIMSLLKRSFAKTLLTKIGYMLTKGGIRELKALMDYRETGGTALIGLTKPVIKAHGSSDARAIRSAVRQAIQSVERGADQAIAARIGELAELKEQSHAE
ncbi:MAG: phosphate acyltransferase PlsX [Oscillospiraceae bacterium]|nr:phosphate acyltransferase PlsX [Oscillospiraceae bacterium]